MTLLLAVLSAAPVNAVVMDIRTGGGAAADQAVIVTAEIAHALPAVGFKVTTARELTAVLEIERQKELLGCTDESAACAAELAAALGSDVVVQGTLDRLDKGLHLSVAFIAGRDGATLDRLSIDAPSMGALIERVREDVSAAASRLFARQRPGERLDPGRTGFRRWAVIPGVAGAVLAAVGVGMFVVTGNTWARLNSRTNSVENPDALADSGRSSQAIAWALCVTGGVALAATAAVLWFGAPQAPRVIVAPVVGDKAAGVSLSGAFP